MCWIEMLTGCLRSMIQALSLKDLRAESSCLYLSELSDVYKAEWLKTVVIY